MANKNRIQPPSKIVHFFNTPPDLTEETVNRVFVERGIEAPTTIKLFPLKSERSSSGLIEFSSVGIAVAAIMECNHTALENSSKYRYHTYTIVKLAVLSCNFSTKYRSQRILWDYDISPVANDDFIAFSSDFGFRFYFSYSGLWSFYYQKDKSFLFKNLFRYILMRYNFTYLRGSNKLLWKKNVLFKTLRIENLSWGLHASR